MYKCIIDRFKFMHSNQYFSKQSSLYLAILSLFHEILQAKLDVYLASLYSLHRQAELQL